jgi:hypothetical protein
MTGGLWPDGLNVAAVVAENVVAAAEDNNK